MRRFGRWAAALFLAPALAAASPVPAVIEAYLHQREGDAEAALRSLEAALDEDPASAYLRAEIARTLARERRYGEALAVVDEGLARRPGHPELLLLRAQLLQVMNRSAEAAQAAAEAARGGAGDRAYDLAVRIHESQGSLEEAAELAARWAEASGSADAWFARGRLLARLGRAEEARAALRRALDRDPNHRAALRALA
ncbi:MAG: tetratricopeptide repeat protein, partial [Candidatus Dadabacteria bacterium]